MTLYNITLFNTDLIWLVCFHNNNNNNNNNFIFIILLFINL